MVTREFTQLRTTCTRARPTAACLGLSGRLARDYNDCAYASKAPGVPVYIEIPEPPWFYDGVLLVYKVAYVYIVVHAKIPVSSFSTSVPVAPPGPSGSGTAMGLDVWIRPALFLSWTSSIKSTATGPPNGLHASATSVGHLGLPDSRHYCWVPVNHTHNSSPRSSS